MKPRLVQVAREVGPHLKASGDRARREANLISLAPCDAQPIKIARPGRSLGFVTALTGYRKYLCPVCLSVMKDPVQTKCGHRFCRACILRISGPRQYAKCPVDNTWFYINGDMFDDVAVSREILVLSCMCDNEKNGCHWKGELFYLQEHLDFCDFCQVTCPNGCEQQYLRQQNSSHLQDCPLRMVECSQCCENVTAKDLTRHQLLLCPKLPVSCVLCGRNGILREEIPKHVSEEGNCPNTPIPCQFEALGCTTKVRRCDLILHIQSNTVEHLALMANKILIQEKLIEKQNTELEQLRRTTQSSHARILIQREKIMDDINERISQIEIQNSNSKRKNTEAT
ncbi:TNF receptor-associated factor 6-like isoform X2 [Anneissia japonica]|uniref:TNF receptor-associated factor 6-like isoform X2 n=1 Tax=Anneissia japonica TaxID=1529436 RepID=UPI0014256E18|nr:TNF receptor-associated factor 6-like isoform X2 [Anneissia japonica]